MRAPSGVRALAGYERAWLRVDVAAGITVAAMLVPQAMAYAELAGLPPEAGFRAALPALVVYALLGSSRHLGVGPEPGTALLAATAVTPLAGADLDAHGELMAALALLVGAVAAIGAIARFGAAANLLSRPVLVGYLCGVGITLLASQLGKLTGLRIESADPLPQLWEVAREVGDVDVPTLVLGITTLAAILVLRSRRPRLPGVLLAVAAATVAAELLADAGHSIALVGEIPGAFPAFGVPSVSGSDLAALVPAALGITVVGYADNVLTARSIAARHGYRVEPTAELAALGAENLAAGLAGGFPVSSSASRSALPAALGSKTQVVGLVAAGTLAIALLGLRPLIARFPSAAIAAVIVAAAIAILDVAELRAIWRLSRRELSLAVVTATGVIVFDVLVGIAVAIGLSLALTLDRIARPRDAVLGESADLDGWIDVEAGGRPLPGLLVYRFEAPLFFANAARFRERVQDALHATPGSERWVVLDFEAVGSIDTTAVTELGDIVAELLAAGVDVVGVARPNVRCRDTLTRAALLEPPGPLRPFLTINEAVRSFRRAEGNTGR